LTALTERLGYRAVPQRQRLWQSLIQLMPFAKPNDLHLVFVKLQVITGHPIANAFKAAGKAFNCFLALGSWYTDIQLYRLLTMCLQISQSGVLLLMATFAGMDIYHFTSVGEPENRQLQQKT